MSDLAMNFNTNDLLITNGDLSLVTDETAIEQDLQQSLQVWYGEWFLDTTFGIPYKQQILIKNPNLDIVQTLLLIAATNVAGVTQILDFEFTYDSLGRAVSVFIVAQTSNGETIEAQINVGLPTTGGIEGTPYP